MANSAHRLSRRSRDSVRFQVRTIIYSIDGIGTSKLDSRHASDRKSLESGHKVSPMLHSVKSITNLRRELTDLATYAKVEHGVGKIAKIDAEIVRSWIGSKEIGYRTASNYLSNLNKIADHLAISREEVAIIRQELSPQLPRPAKDRRSYKHLDRLQVAERAMPAMRLQRDYGLRAGAATHINLDKQLHGNVLSYREKGGKWSQKVLDKDLVSQLHKNAQNGSYAINYKTYTRDLRQGIENLGEEWHGTHGLRHSYAQRRLEEGASLGEVSLEMGHVREEITLAYLR